MTPKMNREQRQILACFICAWRVHRKASPAKLSAKSGVTTARIMAAELCRTIRFVDAVKLGNYCGLIWCEDSARWRDVGEFSRGLENQKSIIGVAA